MGIPRIDRVYANYGQAVQIDRQIHCTALFWPEPLTSAQRALLFVSKAVGDQPDHTRGLGDRCLEHPEWLHRVLAHLRHLKDLEPAPGPGTGLRQLVVLERAVLVATQNIQKDLAKTMRKHEPDDGSKDLSLIRLSGVVFGRAPALGKAQLELKEVGFEPKWLSQNGYGEL